jgi:hypothetical protein
MKKLLFLVPVFFSVFAMAQCPQTSCQDSLASNVTQDALTVAAGFTNIQWSVISGPGTIGSGVITGLKAGQTTVLLLTATQGNANSFSWKVITLHRWRSLFHHPGQ